MVWQKIKAEYIAGGTSYRKLAEKYKVSRTTLERKAKDEKWSELRRQAEVKAEAKIINAVSEKSAKIDDKYFRLVDKLMSKAEETIENLDVTQYLYRSVDYSILRTVAGQLQNGIIIAKEDLQCGDLVFFQNTTGYGHFASHVGIYIGNNQIVHAGDGGVGIADLDDSYFVRHYMCARRVVLTDPTGESPLPAEGITQNINGSYWRESSQTDGSGNSFFPILRG